MKIIGRTNEGGVLLEISLEEYAALLAVSNALNGLPAFIQAMTDEPGSVPVPVEETRKTRTGKDSKDKKDKRADKTIRLCAWCDKPLGKGYGPLATTHKGACQKLYRRKQSRESWRKRKGVKNPCLNLDQPPKQTSMINPSDPILTDEQRERIKADRLAGMRVRNSAG